MNRLWVKLSISIGLAMLLVSVLPVVLFFGLRFVGVVEFTMPSELAGANPEQIQAAFERLFLGELVRNFIIAAVTGIAAGVFISRLIARPLYKLEKGARAIGAQNLDYRVEIERGSDEIMAVAGSFNQMAGQLQVAEKQRQNLLADVAHELRTPLTVLQGNLRGIIDDVFPLDKEEIGRLLDQTEHLTHLVNDLHELAQAEAHRLPLNLAQVDLPKLLHRAAAAFRPLADEGQVELRVELLGRLPALKADRDRLLQAVSNLVSNALRHTPPGGVVTLQAEQVAQSCEIRIIDTGQGIPTSQLPHVFERFYRSDPARARTADHGGTGLGLAIVKAVVESHGGTATVQSEGPDHGSTFTLAFPLNF